MYYDLTSIRTFKILIACVLTTNILSFNSCAPPGDDVDPEVNEGIYINELYASGVNWIELYNDLETSIDLGGYFIYDNVTSKYEIPGGTTIQAKGFLVLICDDTGVGLSTNFKLSSGGETVYLENPKGTLINRVEFPHLSAGQSYGRYPDGSNNLAISGTLTKGQTNGGTETPAIVNTTREPIVPALNQTVVIKSTLVSNQGLASVKLYYRFNSGSYSQLTMTPQNGIYISTLPAQSSTGKVEYYLEAVGNNGMKSYEPATAPAKVLSYLLNTDPLPNLVINEFMAFNSACCPDKSSGSDEFDDWIEIYNTGSVPVNIADMYLSDNKLNPFNFKIPNDDASKTTIEPGKFMVVWADNSPEQGQLHLDFALSNGGEDVGLYYIDGRKIDDYSFGTQSQNVSLGRTTNGAPTWKTFNTPTPGASN